MGQSGDLFWQLVEQEHERALAYCGRLARNPEEGDDLYQDSIIKAFDGFVMLRRTASFRPWFYRIINNTYKARFRDPWWKRLVSRQENVEDSDIATNPAHFYDARRRLEYALAALSADDRILVTLAELEDWSIAELAALTSKTDGFIKMRLSRARKKMRKRLSSSNKSAGSVPTQEKQKTYAMPPDATEIE